MARPTSRPRLTTGAPRAMSRSQWRLPFVNEDAQRLTEITPPRPAGRVRKGTGLCDDAPTPPSTEVPHSGSSAGEGGWVSHARRTGGRKTTGRAAKGPGSDANAVRAWARAQGLEVSDRGRVSAEIRKAYDAAH